MTTSAALAPIVRALDQADIPHMLTGSFASSVHGTIRSTADVDLVVEIDEAGFTRLMEVLVPERYYVPIDSARAAVRQEGTFNVIDLETGWKVDLIVRRSRPFSRSEFGRRQPATVAGVDVFVTSAEDTILAKLEWALLGGSARQIEDVVGVLRIRTGLDDAYLDEWAPQLGVAELLARARREAAADS